MKIHSNNGRKASNEMLVIPSADTEQEAQERCAVGRRSFLKGLGMVSASLLPASALLVTKRGLGLMNFLHVAKTLNKLFCHMTRPRLIKTPGKDRSESLQIADAVVASTRLSLSLDLVSSALRRRLYLGVCFLSIGTAAAMGSGSGSSGGSVESTPLQQEVGISAFKVYNQGVDLMLAKKFAAAQIKFEQAIRDNPDFAEAHNNLGFTLREQGPQNYAKALAQYNKAIQLKPSMAETYEYRGVLFAKMGKKSDAEKDLAALKKLNLKLASELAEFLKTGKEEDEYAPTSPKQKS
jgi:hypothetical protein